MYSSLSTVIQIVIKPTSIPREKFLARNAQESTFLVESKKNWPNFPEILKYRVVITMNEKNSISFLDKSIFMFNFNIEYDR